MKAVLQFIARRPWIFVVLAFVLLIGSWVALIYISAHHPTPEFKVPLPPHHP
ncbi:MAG: hypothetical protein WCK77_19905 [Verrucomicrobiota bacterium]